MAETPDNPSKWSDLGTRILSAIVILALAIGALLSAPWVWSVFVLLVYVLMLRELAGLCEPGIGAARRSTIAAMPMVVAAFTLIVPEGQGTDPDGFEGVWTAFRLGFLRVALVALVPLGLGILLLRASQTIWLAYGLLLAAAAISLTFAHVVAGPVGLVALVGIVIISDVAGYFAGRAMGGPKFWPRISPKKTWSGTVAGWLGAGLFGGLIGPSLLGVPLVWAALGAAILAFAGQMGDILESWLKRRAGVKDSSRLIPGHGGVLDRLDALVAVAALAGIAGLLMGYF